MIGSNTILDLLGSCRLLGAATLGEPLSWQLGQGVMGQHICFDERRHCPSHHNPVSAGLTDLR